MINSIVPMKSFVEEGLILQVVSRMGAQNVEDYKANGVGWGRVP
jgi:hypothetical protein